MNFKDRLKKIMIAFSHFIHEHAEVSMICEIRFMFRDRQLGEILSVVCFFSRDSDFCSGL